jgi:tetratricopeptide (TPR) repeat protein
MGDETKKNKERGKRIRDKGLAVGLLLFSSGLAVFAGREVWAAAPLLVEKQAREGSSWSPVGHEGLVQTYKLANERSPDFRRSQRVGQIYHLAYERGDESAFVKAEKFYKQSLDRHPYNPVPLLNLANLYRGAGLYAEAEAYYGRAKPYVAARDWYFKYYTQRAQMMIAQGESAYTKGEFDAADLFLAGAAETVMLGQSASQPREQIQRDCYVARVRIAIEQGLYEKADGLWAETRKHVRPWILSEKGSVGFLAIGDAYFDAASAEWKTRKPELAKQLYLMAQSFYKQDKGVRKGELDKQRDEHLAFVEQALSILKQGGF